MKRINLTATIWKRGAPTSPNVPSWRSQAMARRPIEALETLEEAVELYLLKKVVAL
jgi:hypothetical protein